MKLQILPNQTAPLVRSIVWAAVVAYSAHTIHTISLDWLDLQAAQLHQAQNVADQAVCDTDANCEVLEMKLTRLGWIPPNPTWIASNTRKGRR